MKRKVLAVTLIAAMVLGMTACSPADAGGTTAVDKKKDDGTINIGVLLKPESNEYWATMKKAMEEWDEENEDVTLDILCAESEDNISGELEQLENMISKNYDAICAAPLSSSNLVEGVVKACNAGIPIVNIDEAIDEDAVKEAGGNMVVRYTSDNEVVGQQGAEFITEQIGSGKVAIIEGTAGNVVSNSRTKGATDYFEENGITVAASQSGEWDRLSSIDVATNIMQSNPDIKAFYCANDTMALGVYEAVVNAGKEDDILVVGTDAAQNAKESIKDGQMAASVGQDNVKIGISCIEAAVKAVKDGWTADSESEMPIEYIDSFLVTSENVDDYL